MGDGAYREDPHQAILAGSGPLRDFEAVVSALHDAVWEAVPLEAVPEELALRLGWLLASVPRAATVLDIGCGAGEFSAALTKRGAQVIAVDVAAEALRRARERSPDLDARLWQPGEPLPVEDNAVDIVWAGEVIEHVADVAPWLSEIRRVLRPRGVLLLTTPHHGPLTMLGLALSPRRFQRHFDPRNDHLRFFSPMTLGRLLDDLGFSVAELTPAGGRIGMRSTILARAVRG
ncbi:MAG TPA: methyltransferase domain-containing protein [Solirubrobacteraceae bacterium]|nr:methyltransferase domain-containing protein [Solirubrobacteraceae bacterium]